MELDGKEIGGRRVSVELSKSTNTSKPKEGGERRERRDRGPRPPRHHDPAAMGAAYPFPPMGYPGAPPMGYPPGAMPPMGFPGAPPPMPQNSNRFRGERPPV